MDDYIDELLSTAELEPCVFSSDDYEYGDDFCDI